MKKSKFWGLILLGLLVTLATLIGCFPTTQGQEEQPTGLQGTLPMILIMILLIAMFYFLMIRPARQREKKQKEIVTSLQPGDIVITASGIFGKIESMREDSVGPARRIAREVGVSYPTALRVVHLLRRSILA